MSRFFWIAYSANARGASEELRNRLLDHISTDSGKDWHKDPTYQLIWHNQYQEVVNDYCKAIMKLSQAWVSSPAGKRFQEACAKTRRAGKAVPTFEIACLREYDGGKGIDFGIEQILSIFGVLTEVADTSTYPPLVSPLNIWLINSVTAIKTLNLNGLLVTMMQLYQATSRTVGITVLAQ